MGIKTYTLEEVKGILENKGYTVEYVDKHGVKALYIRHRLCATYNGRIYSVYKEDAGKVETLYSGFNEDKASREVLKAFDIKTIKYKEKKQNEEA